MVFTLKPSIYVIETEQNTKCSRVLKLAGGHNPLHHKKKKIPSQEYSFQCKHCSLQKLKSTNIYVPVYPYLQGMLFHIRKHVKYL